MPVPTADLAIASIRSDIADIRAALVRLGKLPANSPPEPQSGTMWVNIYERPDGLGVFPVVRVSRAFCEDDAREREGESQRLACVRVDWTEGDGLSDEQEAS